MPGHIAPAVEVALRSTGTVAGAVPAIDPHSGELRAHPMRSGRLLLLYIA